MQLLQSEGARALGRARAILDTSYADSLTLGQVARQVGFSRHYLIRAFRHAFGVTPHQYLTQQRLARARDLLLCGDLSVTEVCFAVGFQSPASFSALFRRHVGQPPRAFRLRAHQRRHLLQRAIPHCFLTMFGPAAAPLANHHAAAGQL